jgi:hypothetical protein
MGQAYNYRCTNCFNAEELTEGVGMSMCPIPLKEYLERKHLYIHYKIHRKLFEIAKEHPFAFIETEYNIYKCKNCDCISSKMNVKVDDGFVYENIPRCSHCSSNRIELYEVNQDVIEKCPKCKEKTLRHEIIMMWD